MALTPMCVVYYLFNHHISIKNNFQAVDGTPLLNQKQKVILKNGCAQIVQLSANLVQLLTNEQSEC